MVAERVGAASRQGPAASLMEISRVLEETARLVRQHAEGPTSSTNELKERVPTIAQVRAIITARRLRREYLGLDVSDATWAMMLELFAAGLEGRRVHQTMLCVTAAVAQTTALRVTRKLLDAGIFLGAADAKDDRLLILRLSDDAARRIRTYLAATQGIIDAA